MATWTNQTHVMPVQAESIESWISDNWKSDLTVREWWAVLADAGYAFPTWPTGLGGLSAEPDVATAMWKALGRARVIGPPPGLGTLMGGPVICTHGNAEQQHRLLPALANGTEGWCQLFSEPGAGSDLAAVATKAERDGDEWVVTGQKVWTSGASHARRGMLIARTDWEQPKHHGLTYFIVDLEQPGVEIRAIKQMNGKSHFNEVFLTEVRIDDRDRIGDVNRGWEVAGATLRFERSGLSAATSGVLTVHSGGAGNLDRLVGDIVIEHASAKREPDETAPGTFASLSSLARNTVRSTPDDATLRDRLVDVYARERLAEFSRQRTRNAQRSGTLLGSESSTAKLWWTEGLRKSADLGLEILGPDAMLVGRHAATSGELQTYALSVPSASIAGGTDEVQRNIIGERGLGLPKDLSVDSDIAFKDVKRS